MPKEITHWKVAEKVRENLQHTPLGKILGENRNCLMLGAIFPDCLYYTLWKSPRYPVHEIPRILHGTNGEDTFQIIRNIIGNLNRNQYEKDPIVAFLVGIYAHLVTDITFHPMIYYFTGNCGHCDPKVKTAATQSHRRLECLMDLFFCENYEEISNYSLKQYLNHAEISLPKLLESTGLFSEDVPKDKFIKSSIFSLNLFSKVQILTQNERLAQFLYRIENRLNDPLKEIVTLFYAPQLSPLKEKISGKMEYKNPYSGKKFTKTLPELFQRAVLITERFCARMEKPLIEGKEMSFDAQGSSLSAGIKAVSVKDFGFFSEKKFIET